MKETKSKVSSSKDNFIYKLAGFGLVILLFWMLLAKGNTAVPGPKPPNVTQVTSQLSGVNNGKEWGTAAKTTDGIKFGVNVTAFLPKPAKGFNYYVYLKGDGADQKDMILGKMDLSGDVFSLNYQSDMDYFGYKSLVVVKQTEAQAKEAKITSVVLTGGFSK